MKIQIKKFTSFAITALFVLALAGGISGCKKKTSEQKQFDVSIEEETDMEILENWIQTQMTLLENTASVTENSTDEMNYNEVEVTAEEMTSAVPFEKFTEIVTRTGPLEEISDNVTRTPTGLYAISSPEGLRLRDKPELSAEKVGLLEYQQTVKVLSIDEKEVTIDGITSSWYEVVPVKTAESDSGDVEELHGYAFGGYLVPLYTVKIENCGTYNFASIRSDFIEKELPKQTEYVTSPWELEDGIYSPKTVTFQTPCLHHLYFRGVTRTYYCCIQNKNIYYISNCARDDRNYVEFYMYSPFFDNTEISANFHATHYLMPEKFLVASVGERSGGGDYGYISYENNKLQYISTVNEFAYFEQLTFELEKDSTSAEINYEIQFPWFLNGDFSAWSTIDVSKDADLNLEGNMRYYDENEYGHLTDEALKSFVELTDMHMTNYGIVYEGFYRGNKVYIKAESINKSVRTAFRSPDAIEQSVSFEYGM